MYIVPETYRDGVMSETLREQLTKVIVKALGENVDEAENKLLGGAMQIVTKSCTIARTILEVANGSGWRDKGDIVKLEVAGPRFKHAPYLDIVTKSKTVTWEDFRKWFIKENYNTIAWRYLGQRWEPKRGLHIMALIDLDSAGRIGFTQFKIKVNNWEKWATATVSRNWARQCKLNKIHSYFSLNIALSMSFQYPLMKYKLKERMMKFHYLQAFENCVKQKTSYASMKKRLMLLAVAVTSLKWIKATANTLNYKKSKTFKEFKHCKIDALEIKSAHSTFAIETEFPTELKHCEVDALVTEILLTNHEIKLELHLVYHWDGEAPETECTQTLSNIKHAPSETSELKYWIFEDTETEIAHPIYIIKPELTLEIKYCAIETMNVELFLTDYEREPVNSVVIINYVTNVLENAVAHTTHVIKPESYHEEISDDIEGRATEVTHTTYEEISLINHEIILELHITLLDLNQAFSESVGIKYCIIDDAETEVNHPNHVINPELIREIRYCITKTMENEMTLKTYERKLVNSDVVILYDYNVLETTVVHITYEIKPESYPEEKSGSINYLETEATKTDYEIKAEPHFELKQVFIDLIMNLRNIQEKTLNNPSKRKMDIISRSHKPWLHSCYRNKLLIINQHGRKPLEGYHHTVKSLKWENGGKHRVKIKVWAD